MIKGVAHVAYVVMDMEKSINFYCNILGLKKAFTVNDDEGNPWIINVKAAEGQYIELIYGGKENLDYDPANAGYSHLCLEVEDINKVAQTLVDNSIILDVEPVRGKDLNFQCWAKDPDGNRIEFMQFDPDSPQIKGTW